MMHTSMSSFPNRYEVRLGHAQVTVEGRTTEEAIQQARRLLCQDMPRLYDVIQSLTSDRFQVNLMARRESA
jgi:hypothetical protein